MTHTKTRRRRPGSPPQLSTRQKRFFSKLNDLGFDTYMEYLTSDHWYDLRERYRHSKLSQNCLICFDPNVDLHHRTYKRLGAERLNDLVPLCRLHHEQAHELERAGSVSLWDAAKALKRARASATKTGLPDVCRSLVRTSTITT
jgi:hypothetical protein